MAKHEITAFEEDFLEDGETAICSCGWRSHSGDHPSVQAQFANHVAYSEDRDAAERTKRVTGD